MKQPHPFDMKLQSFTLQIFEQEKMLSFYINVLGFKLLNKFSENNSIFYNLCFESTHSYLQLRYTPSLKKTAYQQESTDNYWKYSLFINDIQKVYRKLQKQNYAINEPYQFGDIGYLAHTTDPENHQIEFIQKTFKTHPLIVSNTHPIEKQQTVLGLVTIRTKDPIKSIHFFEKILDLKLFVRMYVNRGKGFTLYFLGDKNIEAPNPNIDALENREWMYQQNHLFIEIQHYWNSEYDTNFLLKSTSNNGLKSINFSGDINLLKAQLIMKNITFLQENNKIIFETIDKHIISLENCIQQRI
ncbi:VOC family protein [Aquimarina sp. AU474]|uniref:VOC family protein n=1 Tax=Aquimarina sp. AU474 TaxID=2108529 RepID=UPI000D6855FD|nr:VOC family protein [Aquimarina sp. AU474]